MLLRRARVWRLSWHLEQWYDASMVWLRSLCLIWVCTAVWCQTDETIFREFKFDFATPGARANAMGRAFVGLADEATAAYNNPAGLSVLSAPEFSLEYRQSVSDFEVLQENAEFSLRSGEPKPFTADLDRLGFASFSFSTAMLNVSLFYVNHLDYQRSEPLGELTRWRRVDRSYEFSYINKHDVFMELNTFGVSFSRQWGRASFGVAVGQSEFQLDYAYETKLVSDFIGLNDLVMSRAEARSRKPSYVAGTTVQITPRVKWGLVFKVQPEFRYLEYVNNPLYPPDEVPEGEPIQVAFKVPDSVNTGFSFQPNNVWTVLLDFDLIRYSQLGGSRMTIISGDQFDREDYRISDVVEVHVGAEYLIPIKRRHIVALRGGWFLDPDHKTRFVGRSEGEVYEIQDFIFNTGTREDNRGFTGGLGYVWNNRVQLDFAVIRSDQYDWIVSSLLYRF